MTAHGVELRVGEPAPEASRLFGERVPEGSEVCVHTAAIVPQRGADSKGVRS